MKSRSFLTAICFFFLTASISFGYTATFMPRISVDEQYTDNVNLTSNNDLKEDDFITTVTPGFTAELVGKKGNATASYDASYAFYNTFNDYNHWRQAARLNGEYGFTKFTQVNVLDRFIYTEDPEIQNNVAEIRTEEPTVPVDTTVRKTRNIYYANFASVGLDHQFGKYQSFRLGYDNYILNNDDPRYQDKERHDASAGLTYWFGPKWGFDVSGRYTRGIFQYTSNVKEYSGSVSLLKKYGKHFTGYIRYTQFVVNYDDTPGKDTTYSPTIGFRYDIEKDISLFADAGFFYTDSEFRENTSGPTGDLRMIKRFEHAKLNFALLGGYTYDLYGAEDNGYGTYYEASVSYNRQLGKHVSGNIFGSYRDTKYKDLRDREDKNPIVGIGVSWQALQWMNLGLDYRYRSVDSTVETQSYDENSVFVRVTLTPKVPYHTSRY